MAILVLLVGGVAPGDEPTPWTRVLAWIILVALLAAFAWLRRCDRLAYEAALTEQAARTAVAEDRLAIARDLHDLVSGSLGAITVRAAVAQRLETDVTGLRTALADVEATSRSATTDLRSMLAVLRGQGPAPDAVLRRQDLTPASAPGTPALADAVGRAAAGARGLGLSVRTQVHPGAASGPAQDLALAVVREGLANAARHAGPTTAEVTVRDDGDVLAVEVRDEGRAPGWRPQPGTGSGLPGLAERAATLGAELIAGPPDAECPGAGDAEGPAVGRAQIGEAAGPGTGDVALRRPGFVLRARIPLDAGASR